MIKQSQCKKREESLEFLKTRYTYSLLLPGVDKEPSDISERGFHICGKIIILRGGASIICTIQTL